MKIFNTISTEFAGMPAIALEGYEDIVVAVSCNGRKNSKKWEVVYIDDLLKEGPQLDKKSVGPWLVAYIRVWIEENIIEAREKDQFRVRLFEGSTQFFTLYTSRAFLLREITKELQAQKTYNPSSLILWADAELIGNYKENIFFKMKSGVVGQYTQH